MSNRYYTDVFFILTTLHVIKKKHNENIPPKQLYILGIIPWHISSFMTEVPII